MITKYVKFSSPTSLTMKMISLKRKSLQPKKENKKNSTTSAIVLHSTSDKLLTLLNNKSDLGSQHSMKTIMLQEFPRTLTGMMILRVMSHQATEVVSGMILLTFTFKQTFLKSKRQRPKK